MRIAVVRTVVLLMLAGILQVVAASPGSSADQESTNLWWTGTFSVEIHETDVEADPDEFPQGSYSTSFDVVASGSISTPAVHPDWPGTTAPRVFDATWGSVEIKGHVSETWDYPDPEAADVDCETEQTYASEGSDAGAGSIYVENVFDDGLPLIHGLGGGDGFTVTATKDCVHDFQDEVTTYPGDLDTSSIFVCQRRIEDTPPNEPDAVWIRMPAAQQELDGTRTISGSVSHTCNGGVGPDRVRTRTQTYTFDLVGSPVPPEPVDAVTLSVSAKRIGSGIGRVLGTGDVINCGSGQNICTATVERGTPIRLAALPGEWSKVASMIGCDPDDVTACLVTMNSDRSVTIGFALDLDAVYPPEPATLLSPERKVEVATNGAKAASEGSAGCAAVAGFIGATIATGGTVVVGGAGAAEVNPGFASKVLDKTAGDCAEGLAGTIYNGLLLKVDPPDPAWRNVALPTPYPVSAVPRCPLRRNCAAIRRAWSQHEVAQRRVTEIREAIAVAANRYGNAVTHGDLTSRRLHRATWRAYSGMLVPAVAAEAAAGARLVTQLKRGRLTSLVVTLAGARRAKQALLAGRAIPVSTLTRALSKRLITSRAGGIADIKTEVRRSTPRRFDALVALATPERTGRAATDAAALRLRDLELILGRLQADRGVSEALRNQQQALLNQAWKCDGGTASSLTQLAGLARAAASGLGLEGGRLISFLALKLASRGGAQGAGCPS